jgi:hypothetical protein
MPSETLPVPFQDDTRTLSVPQRRVLYWRWVTGGQNRSEAAEIAGVTVNTIYVWLRSEDFRKHWDNPESWAQAEIRSQRAGLELKALHKAHELLDAPDERVSPAVKADVMAKSLTDVRQTKQLETGHAAGEAWAAMLEQWARRSAEILGVTPSDSDNAVAIEAEAISVE